MTEIPSSYNEISSEQGISVVKTGTRIMEFVNESGATFTLFENIRGGYIGRLTATDDDMQPKYYEVDPVQVAENISGWPGEGEEPHAELATLPLMNAGWELTYYDDEHATMRISDSMRD